jgi:hypothetical protein
MADVTQAPNEKGGLSNVDIEGAAMPENYTTEAGVLPESESDESAARKQDGVKQIEAVTSVWNRKTLWLMMVL